MSGERKIPANKIAEFYTTRKDEKLENWVEVDDKKQWELSIMVRGLGALFKWKNKNINEQEYKD